MKTLLFGRRRSSFSKFGRYLVIFHAGSIWWLHNGRKFSLFLYSVIIYRYDGCCQLQNWVILNKPWNRPLPKSQSCMYTIVFIIFLKYSYLKVSISIYYEYFTFDFIFLMPNLCKRKKSKWIRYLIPHNTKIYYIFQMFVIGTKIICLHKSKQTF